MSTDTQDDSKPRYSDGTLVNPRRDGALWEQLGRSRIEPTGISAQGPSKPRKARMQEPGHGDRAADAFGRGPFGSGGRG